ncbi:MAG: hypothetical protein HY329_22425 [Chloroflexi bacterium]|nr:hypothetical protein [Chloroflexota bacterium]
MPTATVCTDEFHGLGRQEAESLGIAGLPIVVVPHPMGGLREPEVDERADVVVEEIVAALTGNKDEIERAARDRQVTTKRTIRDKPLFA